MIHVQKYKQFWHTNNLFSFEKNLIHKNFIMLSIFNAHQSAPKALNVLVCLESVDTKHTYPLLPTVCAFTKRLQCLETVWNCQWWILTQCRSSKASQHRQTKLTSSLLTNHRTSMIAFTITYIHTKVENLLHMCNPQPQKTHIFHLNLSSVGK